MKSIILIGPMRAGKTTVSQLLADTLHIPNIRLDQIKAGYYAEMGYDVDHARELHSQGGLEKLLPYLKPFEAQLVERILTEYAENHVIDFGAGHSVYEEADLFDRVQAALSAFENVIYITPCADPEEAIRILHQRDLDDAESGLPAINRLFVTHPSNTILSRHIIYNQHQTPAQTCAEIMAFIQRDVN